MTNSSEFQPTEAEVAILKVLWERGASTVRDVHDTLGGDARSRYTTTLKQMQVMAEKRLVRRDSSHRSHVYSAAVDEAATSQSLVQSFVDRIFDGSVRKMVLHALGTDNVSSDELAEIKKLLSEREGNQ